MMTSSNEQRNRTTTQHARGIRIVLRQLGAIGMLLGAQTAFAGPMPDQTSDRMESQGNTPHVSQFDPSLILEMTIDAILELIEQINDIQVAQTGGTLEDSADMLTFGYTMFGLEQNLTLQKMGIGLLDCQDALDILQDSTKPLDLSETSKDALELTLEDMILELNDALGN
jgi:hypothetical protein